MADEASEARGQKRRRTRSGCLNCRRKRKKCDEQRPRCVKCERANEPCEWEDFIKFRPPTVIQPPPTSISPVTPVAQTSSAPRVGTNGSNRFSGHRPKAAVSPPAIVERSHTQDDQDNFALSASSGPSSPRSRTSVNVTPRIGNLSQASSRPQSEAPPGDHQAGQFELPGVTEGHDALAQNAQRVSTPLRAEESWSSQRPPKFPPNMTQPPNQGLSPSLSYDGIFEPGSAYSDLFQELRSHVFRTAHSEIGPQRNSLDAVTGPSAPTIYPVETFDLAAYQVAEDLQSTSDTRSFSLSPIQEYVLWKAWTEEVSTWLDKFDPQTHFRDAFPIIAKARPHLKYAMLSLSARYLETRDNRIPPSLTLALYQHAIQLLLPQLYMRDIAVITSCVILCVLEMFSCSPKAWRRHLDGCASLMQSLNLRGDSGGPEEAVFWCFARMDLCGGLMSLEKTLIPVDKWTSEAVSEVSVQTYPRSGSFQDYAKMASNMIAQAMELFATYHASEGAFGFSSLKPADSDLYEKHWRRLFDSIQEWFDTRPMEMLPVMSMPAKTAGSAFPTVLYSNAAAISGNQFAHTAAILMLQRKPRDVVLGKVRSILWHARQICGIALSNDHHGAWTNTVQPVWIAGRLMSNSEEHSAIVWLLQRIERETGWATQWRIDDLKEHWGDADD